MRSIAIKMLLGDRPKYLGLIFGVTFATLLMAQQVSIFIGIMARNAGFIRAVPEADIWVMDQRVQYIEEIEPLRDIELTNVRSVTGVEWAVPFFKAAATIRRPDGVNKTVQLIGIDDISLVGICRKKIMGNPEVIRKPQNAMVDLNGYHNMWPGKKLELNKHVELNDNRLIINAICDAPPTFATQPIIYVSYNSSIGITPQQRTRMSFVLVKAKPGVDIEQLKKRISDRTGLQALTQNEFAWRSINWVLKNTAVPINFGITILMSVIIGVAITAQTFYIFVVENLKQFATMKAVGVTNRQLLSLVLTQAFIVGMVGFGIGIGFTSLYFRLTANTPAFRAFTLHWQVFVGSFVVIALIILFSILISIRKVFSLDPAIVFRG